MNVQGYMLTNSNKYRILHGVNYFLIWASLGHGIGTWMRGGPLWMILVMLCNMLLAIVFTVSMTLYKGQFGGRGPYRPFVYFLRGVPMAILALLIFGPYLAYTAIKEQRRIARINSTK